MAVHADNNISRKKLIEISLLAEDRTANTLLLVASESKARCHNNQTDSMRPRANVATTVWNTPGPRCELVSIGRRPHAASIICVLARCHRSKPFSSLSQTNLPTDVPCRFVAAFVVPPTYRHRFRVASPPLPPHH